MKQLFLYLLSIFAGGFCMGQNSTGPAIAIIPDSSFQLAPNIELKNKLSGKSIIALGEATHGSKEFILMKAGLFNFLNQELGYKDIAIELPQTIGFEIDDYIKGRQTYAYLDSLLRPAKTLYCKEFFSFLGKLRIANNGKPEKEKISIYGIDIDQYFEWALARIKKIAAKYNAGDAEKIALLTSSIPSSHELAFKDGDKYANEMVKTDIDKLKIYLDSINGQFNDADKIKSDLCIGQLLNSYKFWNMNSLSKLSFRDKMMAENTKEIIKLYSIDKLFLWAHNGHVRKNDFGVKRLGEHLENFYKEKYYCIGAVFSEGSYRVYYKGILSQMSLPASTCGPLADYLGAFNRDYLFCDVSGMPEEIKSTKTEIHDVGIVQTTTVPKANRYSVKPITDFDAFIYFRKINSLDLIKD